MQCNSLLEQIGKYDDQQSFKKLFDLLSQKVFNRCHSIVKDHQVAEEIVEDVFFKLWQIRHKYHTIRNVEAFLMVSARNLSYDFLKKKKIPFAEDTFLNFQVEQVSSSPEDILLLAELQEQISLAVAELPTRCKRTFELVRFEGFSHKEAAKKLKISPKTVENQLRIAVSKILSRLNSYIHSEKNKMAS